MSEGWHHDHYYLFFEPDRITDLTRRYGVERFLPGYAAIGLRDSEFILRDTQGRLFLSPTVPLRQDQLSALEDVPDNDELRPDTSLQGKIEWREPSSSKPTTVDLLTHTELVNWWNQKAMSSSR